MEFHCKNSKFPTIPHIFRNIFKKKFSTPCKQIILSVNYQPIIQKIRQVGKVLQSLIYNHITLVDVQEYLLYNLHMPPFKKIYVACNK